MAQEGAPRQMPRRNLFAEAAVIAEPLAGGGLLLRSPYDLGEIPRSVGSLLETWAAREPARVFLAQRDASGAWRRVTYGEALAAARAIGQALLDRGLGPERPVMVLSDNGIEHALLALGAMHVGVPVTPVSTAYSRLSQDFAKLRYVHGVVAPGADLRR